MDQFTVLHAQAGHALFLDTRSLNFEQMPMPPDCRVVICNTMVKHDLAASAYNQRRAECEQSVRILRERYPAIRALRDVTPEQFARAQALLPRPLASRARHVVTENARVLQAAAALRTHALEELGSLMYESHESLRSDYEVSCAELDTMVALARSFDGTIGARMTGGGFGGCTVNVVRADRAGEFKTHMATIYQSETGIVPEIYDGTPSAGASAIDE